MLSLDSLKKSITADRVGGIVRAVIATGCGMLMAKGMISEYDREFFAGIGGQLAVAAWSWWTNRPEKIVSVRS